MSKLIYLEPDEEITDVIDKISKTDSKAVSLVIPRGSTLANSIVNLKLLVKRSKSLKKDVALVTNDNIAHNLASQIGLPVFESIEDARAGAIEEAPKVRKANVGTPAESVGEIDGVSVHQYDKDGGEIIEPIEPAVEGAAIEGDSEVIEAVHDANEAAVGGEIVEEELIAEADQHPTPIPEPSESSDYKLVKKPMEQKMKHQELPGRDLGGGQVFGKMRSAGSRRKKIITYVSIAVAVLLIFGAYVALPQAKVTLSVVSEPFSGTADIKVNKDTTAVDSANSTIPGKFIEKEEELVKPFAASGTKNIGAKAKGKITIYNYWDDKAHDIAAGSQFVSTSGIKFVSTAIATVPAGHANIIPPSTYEINPPGTVDVNVEAVDVGEAGNVGPTNFTISNLPSVQQSKIYGKSSAAMSGGTNQIVKIVSDKDISDAKASTENELKDTITNKIKADLAGNEKLLDSAIVPSVTSESASAKAGDQVDTFNYSAKIKIDALTFSEDDFKTVLLQSAKGKLASDKEIVTNGGESVKYEVATADIAKGLITLNGTFDGFISSKYDTGAMKSAIKFKSITAATSKLTSYPGVLSANISTTPSFLRSLPISTRRINIEFNYGSIPLTTGGSTSSATGGSPATDGN